MKDVREKKERNKLKTSVNLIRVYQGIYKFKIIMK